MTELHDQWPLSRVELVVLGRLTAAKGATATELAKSLREIGMPLAEPALADCVTATLASLSARELIAAASKPAAKPRKTKKPAAGPRFKLTEAGRDALREAFGGKATPTWQRVSGHIIPALALGEQPGSEAATRALGSVEAMLASLLRDRALGELTTVAQLCDRIVARALGMPPGPVTPDGIRAYALAMHCGGGTKTELEAIAATFAPARTAKRKKPTKLERELVELAKKLADEKLAVESKNKAAIVQSLRRRWVSHQDEADGAQRPSALRAASLQPPRPETTDGSSPGSPDEALLLAVREAIPMVGANGRYGKENVFVSALWQRVARDGRTPVLSLDGFKRWLVTANRNQLLALARADLVDDMDASMVEESEIEDLGATFHFVLDRREPASTPGQVHHG